MSYILDILLCGIATVGVTLGGLISVTFLLAIIQLISYRVFGFNLYKKAMDVIFREVR